MLLGTLDNFVVHGQTRGSETRQQTGDADLNNLDMTRSPMQQQTWVENQRRVLREKHKAREAEFSRRHEEVIEAIREELRTIGREKQGYGLFGMAWELHEAIIRERGLQSRLFHMEHSFNALHTKGKIEYHDALAGLLTGRPPILSNWDLPIEDEHCEEDGQKFTGEL
jgi:hypothetical protein